MYVCVNCCCEVALYVLIRNYIFFSVAVIFGIVFFNVKTMTFIVQKRYSKSASAVISKLDLLCIICNGGRKRETMPVELTPASR